MDDRDPSSSLTVDELSPIQKANLTLKLRQAQRIGLEIKEIEGDLIDRAEAQRQAEAALIVFRSSLLQGPTIVADRLEAAGLVSPGVHRDEASEIIRKWARGLLSELEAKLNDAFKR